MQPSALDPITEFTFLPFGTVDVDMEWDRVLPMLTRVARYAHQPDLPARVRERASNGDGFLDVMYRDRAVFGTVAGTFMPDHLWVSAVYVPPHACTLDVQLAIDARLADRARQRDVRRVRGMQDRRGGERFMDRVGWKQVAVIYEKTIEDCA